MFDGLRFDDETPFTYREGKRLIRLMGDELQKRRELRRLGVDPDGKRRSAITGRGGGSVWDFLPLRVARNTAAFTDYPHLTLALRHDYAISAVTIPNGVKGGFRSKLKRTGENGFRELLSAIQSALGTVLRSANGANAVLYASQRHYRSQRSLAHEDARLEFDLRTGIPGKTGQVKYQPEWTRAIYEVIASKRSNIQLGLEVRWPYDAAAIRSRKALDLFAQSWIAMSPLVDFVLKRES